MNSSFIPLDTVGGLDRGPLCPYVEAYVARLEKQGYKPKTVLQHVRLLAALNRCLVRTHRSIREVDPQLTSRFLRRRLRGRGARTGEWATLRRFIALLREAGVGPKTPVPTPRPHAHLLEPYCAYLLRERGLSVHTVEAYVRWVERFVRWRFGTRRVRVGRLQARDFIGFCRLRAPQCSQPGRNHLVAGLRSLGRFLQYSGRLKRDFSTVVPSVAHWSLSGVPKHLPTATVEQVLARCPRHTPSGRRNYAILLLLARLGLRAGEVLRLTLDDLDWENGLITIRSNKSGLTTRLPLPADAGKAIALYVRHDRPRCASRRVFLRVIAPHDHLSGSPVISILVRQALEHAGVSSVRKGAHLFRHSLATTMLGRGASLEEIGQILRHQSPQTTAIYAKVEFEALRTIALPWPGGAS